MPAATEFAPPGRGTAPARDSAVAHDAATAHSGQLNPDPLPDVDPALNPIIARAYSGATRGAAAMLFSKEAPALSKLGYVAASERWEESRAYSRGAEDGSTPGTLWVTYLAKSITLPQRVCSFCGSELPA